MNIKRILVLPFTKWLGGISHGRPDYVLHLIIFGYINVIRFGIQLQGILRLPTNLLEEISLLPKLITMKCISKTHLNIPCSIIQSIQVRQNDVVLTPNLHKTSSAQQVKVIFYDASESKLLCVFSRSPYFNGERIRFQPGLFERYHVIWNSLSTYSLVISVPKHPAICSNLTYSFRHSSCCYCSHLPLPTQRPPICNKIELRKTITADTNRASYFYLPAVLASLLFAAIHFS